MGVGLDFFKKKSLMVVVSFNRLVPRHEGECCKRRKACYHCVIHILFIPGISLAGRFPFIFPNRYGNHQP